MHASNLKKRFSRQNLLTALLTALSLSLILVIFAPLGTVLNNQSELPLDFYSYADCLLLPAFLLFAALFFIQLLALLIHETAFRIVSALILGTETALCIQQMFLNGKLISSAEGTVLGKISDTEYTLNGIIHLELILAFPLIALYRAKKRKDDAEDNFILRHITAFLACGMLLMQGSGFLTEWIRNSPGKYAANYADPKMLSYKPTLSFSEEQNIVVFLTDRLDGEWCDAVLDEYPELRTELDGFTYYQNTLSHYTYTFPSLAEMLTGTIYDFSEKDSYFARCWQGENAFMRLRDNGFTVNLLPDARNCTNMLNELNASCDNLVDPVITEKYIDRAEIRRQLLKLAAVHTAPYVVKSLCDDAASVLSYGEYIRYVFDENELYSNGVVSLHSDIRLYDFLRSSAFDAAAEKPVCSFIHLNFAHDENPEMVSKLDIAGSNMLYRSIRANFETVFLYLHAAKELGVYDNTTFILIADHGYGVDEDEKSGQPLRPSTAALMIKPANAEHGALKTDSTAALYNDMLPASLLEYAGLDHSAYGDSFADIIRSGKNSPRELIVIRDGKDPPLYYTVNGNAKDLANWQLLPT